MNKMPKLILAALLVSILMGLIMPGCSMQDTTEDNLAPDFLLYDLEGKAVSLSDFRGKPVVLKHTVDSGVIGGVIIRVGDKLIDGSIRSKLAALKRELGGVGR